MGFIQMHYILPLAYCQGIIQFLLLTPSICITVMETNIKITVLC